MNNTRKLQTTFDKPKLAFKKLSLPDSPTNNQTDRYNTYLALHEPTEPLSPTSPGGFYGHYRPVFPQLCRSISLPTSISSLKQKPTSLYNLISFDETLDHKPAENEFEIDTSQKIFFIQNDWIEDVNFYLNSHVFTAKGQVFIVNKKGKIIPKTNIDYDQVKQTIESITQKYSVLSPYFFTLIEFFTSLSPGIALLIKNYLTIDEYVPLNEQLTQYELKKFTFLINNRFCSLLEKNLGVDLHSDSIERIFYSGETGISEPGPYYERITKKGITALNIKFFQITMQLKKLDEASLGFSNQDPQTLFMAYKKRFNSDVMTRDNLDTFIKELPTDNSIWSDFKKFYDKANMIYLNAEQRPLHELQFTAEGLATVSEQHPHQLFDEKQISIEGRKLADTTNKENNKPEIHGKNSAIYVFHNKKILIARDVLGEIHHTYFAEHGVECAGTLSIGPGGKIKRITCFSGHYRPSRRRFHKVLEYLIRQNALNDLEELRITRRVLIKNDSGQSIGTGIRTEVLTDKEEIQHYLKNISFLREQRLKNRLMGNSDSPLARARKAIKKRYFESIFASQLPRSISADQPPPLEWSHSKSDIDPEIESPLPSYSSFSSASSISEGSLSSINSTTPPPLVNSPVDSIDFYKSSSFFFQRKYSASPRRPFSLSPLSPLTESVKSENEFDQMPELEEIESPKNSKKPSFFKKMRNSFNNRFKKQHSIPITRFTKKNAPC